jgi:hypothetical protein
LIDGPEWDVKLPASPVRDHREEECSTWNGGASGIGDAVMIPEEEGRREPALRKLRKPLAFAEFPEIIVRGIDT